MILENNKNQTTPTVQNREQILQSLQPLTTVPLDQLSDEQVNALLDRLTALKQQKRAEKEKAAAQTPPPALTPVHIPASEAPIPDNHEPAPGTSVLKKADEAEAALSRVDLSGDTEGSDGAAVILPDPSCFDHLGEEPTSGVDFDPSMSTYTGTDTPAEDERNYAAPKTDSDYDTRPLSSDDMDEETIAIYRTLVRKRRRQRQILITLITVFTVLLLFGAGFGAYLLLYEPTVDDAPPPFWSGELQPDGGSNPNAPDAPVIGGDDDSGIQAPVISDSYERRDNVYNFLVLGVDRAANLSDVIMVVSYDIKKQTVHVLSLPRDTYINVGSSYHKLNAYFSASYNRSASRGAERYRDAIESMTAFIENGLCIRLDRYVCMDTAGFREIIDAIGGVDMEVPFDMHYEDPEQDLYIHLKAGYQHLDGAKAEQFVRYRSGYLEGDIGRISAQRLFLTALVNQVKTKLDLSSAVSIAKTALQYVTTDLTVAEIGYFAKNAFSVDLDSMTFTTLPGGGVINPDTGASYYVMYAENVRKLVNAQFNVYDREISREVFLSNSRKFTSDAPYISSVFLTEINDSGTVTAGDIQSDAPDIPHR
ncbi:MAG: LytR family transcriptional regulator [Ruminococcaceae bacterium]|nr:LytR family transcriptional regulator [Oscillospiraceae bacterium]